MRTLILIPVTAIVLFCGAVSAQCAPTNIPLTTPAGVCTFIADSYTTVPPSAKGNFGPGCPGYVAPPGGGGGNPAACGPDPAGRFVVGMKFVPSNVSSSAAVYGDLFGWAPAPSPPAVPTWPTSPSTAAPWPGIAVANVIVLSFPNASGYAALKFHTPADMGIKRSGSWTFTQTGSTVIGNVSVAPCPGVLNASAQGYCWANGGEGQGISYGNAAAHSAFTCGLQPNADYYLNLRASPGATCTGGKCSIGIVHRIYGQ